MAKKKTTKKAAKRRARPTRASKRSKKAPSASESRSKAKKLPKFLVVGFSEEIETSLMEGKQLGNLPILETANSAREAEQKLGASGRRGTNRVAIVELRGRFALAPILDVRPLDK